MKDDSIGRNSVEKHNIASTSDEKHDTVSTGDEQNMKEKTDEFEYIVLDFSLLSPLLSKTKCANCNQSTLNFELDPTCWGFSRKITLKCSYCELSGNESFKSHIYTSRRCFKQNTSRAPFDVNTRLSLAFIYAGRGYSSIQQFAMIMNMRSFSCNTFQEHVRRIETAVDEPTKVILDECRVIVKKTYKNSELGSDCEFVESDSNENSKLNFENDNNDLEEKWQAIKKEKKKSKIDLGVSYDGSWPTRGFRSKVGFGSVIDLISGYVVDFDVVTKFCQCCVTTATQLGEDSPEFHLWLEGHANHCSMNHTGSSGAMELTIAENIWKRSKTYGFRYTKMLSDGDSKAFNHVASLNIYGDNHEIQKEECVNHIAKRYRVSVHLRVYVHVYTSNPFYFQNLHRQIRIEYIYN